MLGRCFVDLLRAGSFEIDVRSSVEDRVLRRKVVRLEECGPRFEHRK